MKSDPVEEFCKNDAAPLVRECPECVDKFIFLAKRHEAENAQLRELLDKVGMERAAIQGELMAANTQVDAMRPVVEAAIKCHETFRHGILHNSPYPTERDNNKAFDKAVNDYLSKTKQPMGLPTIEDLLGECRECNRLCRDCGNHGPIEGRSQP